MSVGEANALHRRVKYEYIFLAGKIYKKSTKIDPNLTGRGLTARIRNNILVSLVFAFMRGKQLNNSNKQMKSGSNNNKERRKNVPRQNELQLQSAREKFIKKRRRQLKMFLAFLVLLFFFFFFAACGGKTHNCCCVLTLFRGMLNEIKTQPECCLLKSSEI